MQKKENKTRNQRKANRLFYENQKAFYSNLRYGKSTKILDPPPTKENIQGFWGKLFSSKTVHNKDARWVEQEKREMRNVAKPKWETLTTEDLAEKVRKLKNWKAPGPDKVQNF